MHRFIFMIHNNLHKSGYEFLTKLNKEEQKIFMDKLYREDLTEYERSYNQYKCQIDEYSLFNKAFYNITSLIIIVPFILLCIILRYFKKTEHKNNICNTAVFWGGKDTSIIPRSLESQYTISISQESYALTLQDIKFIINKVIRRHIFSFYFNMKVVYKIALYRGNIISYNPNAFIVTSEYSFTSSILTKYCNENNIRHINVMHGDKIFRKRNSFFKFNECYVWDEHYKKLFISLKADPKQFVIEIPEKFAFKTNTIKTVDKKSIKNNITYYLQTDTKDDIVSIRENLRKINSNFTITIRPHPIYSDRNIINEYFSDFIIEDTDEVDINKSIENSDYIVSLYSTVLFQAYLQNKEVVIDDLINPLYYNILKELDYIMIYKKHIKLSDLV